jgi:hypothetical protein
VCVSGACVWGGGVSLKYYMLLGVSIRPTKHDDRLICGDRHESRTQGAPIIRCLGFHEDVDGAVGRLARVVLDCAHSFILRLRKKSSRAVKT